MKVIATRCPKCNDVVFSRTRHDFRSCSCGNISIDGGPDYTKLLGDIHNCPTFELEIDQTQEELYDDWNHRRDNFGIIKHAFLEN